MTKDDVIAQVGVAAFQAAAERAWAIAAQTARGLGDENGDEAEAQTAFDVISAAVEVVMTAAEVADAKIRLLFELYRETPSFTFLDQLFVHHWNDLPASARAVFWDEVRKLLASSDDRLAGPAQYALWCDFFEDLNEVDEAWEALTGTEAEPAVIERILPDSGPVPFSLKRTLYERLLPDRRWHALIYRSVLHSVFDYCGCNACCSGRARKSGHRGPPRPIGSARSKRNGTSRFLT